MNIKRFLLCLVLVLTVSTVCFADVDFFNEESERNSGQLTEAERVADFKQLYDIIKKSYGMLSWKNHHLGVDLNALTQKYFPLIKKAENDEEFNKLLSLYVREFKDSHFRFMGVSEQFAYLGFNLTLIENKLLIYYISNSLSRDKFDFDKGDEVIEFDGMTADEAVNYILPLYQGGNEYSSRVASSRWITRRSGNYFPIPEGEVKIKIKKRKTGEIHEVVLPWIINGKSLHETTYLDSVANEWPNKWEADIFMNMVAYYEDLYFGEENRKKEAEENAELLSKLPKYSKILQTKPFLAFTFPTEAGVIGYFEFSTYMPRNEKGQVDTQNYLELYKNVIKQMCETTDGLILDQTENGGGSLVYGYQVYSMLIDKKIKIPDWARKVSRKMIIETRRQVGAIKKTNDEEKIKEALEVLKRLEDTFQSGKQWTEFHPIVCTDGYLDPDPDVNYSKPILMLIDSQCYSCGDIFPGIMRDNNRVVLFGETTNGAGGNVNTYGPLTYSEGTFSLTESIMKRSNGEVIEDIGVKPDIEYSITAEDFATGLKKYKQAYIDQITKMVKESKSRK